MATTPLLTRRTGLFAKAETVPGTAETLAAADGKFLVIAPQISPQFETYTRAIARDTLSNVPDIVTGEAAQLSFQLEVRRSNTTTTPDAWSQTLLPACGFLETIGGGACTYTPDSDSANWNTLTMGINVDGYEVILAGCMGNAEFVGTTGEVMLINFTFTGRVVSAGDTALPTVTHETADPYPFQGIDLAYSPTTKFVVASAATAATAGTFTLTVDGQTTGTIAYDDDGTATAAAIVALGYESVTAAMLTGADLSANDAVMEVEVGDRAHKTITINTSGLTGTAHRLCGTVVQVTAAATAATAGTFTLTFNANSSAETATLAYNADATAIQTAIDALSIFSASDAIFTSGTDLGTNNANVYILCNPVTSSSSTNYHVSASLTGLTGNAHTVDYETQELVTGDDICIETLSINMNNDVQAIECANNESGIARYIIVSRDPTISINPQLTLDTDADGLAAYWDHLLEQNMVYVSFHAGSLSGSDSRVAFVAPEIYLTNLAADERNGIAVVTLDGKLTSDTAGGDDELTITLT